MKKFLTIFFIFPFLSSCATKFDDKSITTEYLENMCGMGKIYNIPGSGIQAGYNMRLFDGAERIGRISSADYKRIEKWFSRNCPKGW